MATDRRARRGVELAQEVKQRQAELGHDSPIPAFLNLVTEMLLDFEERLEQMEEANKPFALEVTPPTATKEPNE